jgi:hypothetical protein
MSHQHLTGLQITAVAEEVRATGGAE